MNKLKTLVLMQLRNKLDLELLKDRKALGRSVLLTLIKFVIITAVSFLLLYLFNFLGIMPYAYIPQVLNIILVIVLLLYIISFTFELKEILYFSSDNLVLITFPVEGDAIYLSKLIVYFLYQLKNSISFIVPICFSGILLMTMRGLCSPLLLLWEIIPLIFFILCAVLLSGLLSIVALYIKRLFKKIPLLETIILFGVLVGAIVVIVKLIGLIPENIDLVNQWDSISTSVYNGYKGFNDKIGIFGKLINIMCGFENTARHYVLTSKCFIGLGILVGLSIILIIINFLVSRPIFFNAMSKNFETNKENDLSKRNIKRGKYKTFINKEFTINIRSLDISVNYLFVYLCTPILILLINALYRVIDVGPVGEILIYVFNVLLICLPLLSSNAMVATYYSREGRAGYIKRTKPIYALYPLFVKMFFNALFSIPSVLACTIIYGFSVKFNVLEIVFMSLGILLIHYGHMVYSSTLDLMNPQNEQYATTGQDINNPNETASTIMGFIVSACFSVIAYLFIHEAKLAGEDARLLSGIIKLFFIGCLYFGANVLLFVKKVKAYFYDNERVRV